MNIIIAADSFKGSQTSLSAAGHIEVGIRKVFPEAVITKLPVADGGEGTVDALVLGTKGTFRTVEVTGPQRERIRAKYGILPDGTAVLEMAEASGLLKTALRDPGTATTFGTGQLLLAALDAGCRRVIIGLGGSATNDGGAGFLQAIGVSLKGPSREEIGFGGFALENLETIDASNIDPRIFETEIIIACDVKNPLCGESGASAVFGPQKGADPETVRRLDRCLLHYAAVIKEQLGKDILHVPGGGAAGGLGAAIPAFTNGRIRSGIDAVLDAVGFDEKLKNADLVITGEGRYDAQSAQGKAPAGIGGRAKKFSVPVFAMVGEIAKDSVEPSALGIDALMSILDKVTDLQGAIDSSGKMLEDTAEQMMRILSTGIRMADQRAVMR